MGRKKKNPELNQIGSVEINKQGRVLYDILAQKLIENLQNTTSNQTNDDKNRKKYEKLVINTFNSKMRMDREQFYQKIIDKFHNDEEVRNIIIEMKIKLKEFDYIIKKKWQVLKKFNLQENIYREESRSLIQAEKNNTSEILKSTIERLTASHISGFEPPSVIKGKILSKLQQKYTLDDTTLTQLRNIFIQIKFMNEEENLQNKRQEDQLHVIEKVFKDNSITSPSLNTDVNRNVYFLSKQESKRYEKELELKSGKEQRIDTSMFDGFDSTINGYMGIPIVKKPSSNHLNYEKELELSNDNHKDVGMNVSIDTGLFKPDDSMILDRFDTNTKMKDVLLASSIETIAELKGKIIERLHQKVKDNPQIVEAPNEPEYKSKILNDLNIKLKMFNTLTHFDLQILIHLTHSVVSELVDSKLNNKQYLGVINPTELISFLKKYKIEIQSNSVTVDGKQIQIANPDVSNVEFCLPQHSPFSNFSDDNIA